VERALEQLREAICATVAPTPVDKVGLTAFIASSTVVLPVGGQGSRLRAVTERYGVQKHALRLAGGETMIARAIRMYRDAGFHDFVALVFHQADSVVEALGDGKDLGVQLRYSYDPEIPVGRGGAIRHALDNGAIPAGHHLIVHNPDDVIARYPGSFPKDIVAAHLAGQQRGVIATAVMVDGARAPYTGLRIEDGIVAEVMPYPFVPIPAHMGVTVFSSEVSVYFRELFDLTRAIDFESVLFPRLAGDQKLGAMILPHQYWLQVNDPKSLDLLAALIAEERDTAELPPLSNQ